MDVKTRKDAASTMRISRFTKVFVLLSVLLLCIILIFHYDAKRKDIYDTYEVYGNNIFNARIFLNDDFIGIVKKTDKADIYENGEVSYKSISFHHGIYELRVEKEGYNTWKGIIGSTLPYANESGFVEVNLSKIND